MKKVDRAITLLVKPIGACNQNCSYCFDVDGHKNFHIIDKELIKTLMIKACSEFSGVFGTWHGGECTLVGKEGFKEMNGELQKTAHFYGTDLQISVQTNGTLLDEEGLEIFDTYKIKYSISYDGKDAQKIQRGYDIEDFSFAYNHAYSSISVITKNNIDHLIDMYEEAKASNITQTSYNFVFDSKNKKNLLGDIDYIIKKYKEFIEYYIYDENKEKVVERTTLQGITLALGKGAEICHFQNCLDYSYILCVTSDGNIGKCDTTYNKDFLLANIKDIDNLSDIFQSKQYKYLINLKDKQRNEECLYCIYNPVCSRGCLNCSLTQCDCDIDKIEPYLFHCKMVKALIPFIYNKLSDLKPEELIELNPIVKKELLKRTYLPLSLKILAGEEVYKNG